MNTPESPDIEYLDEQRAFRLLYGSFQFSQGNAGTDLQRDIFQYLHILRPSFRIRSEHINTLSNCIERMVCKLISDGLHLPEEKINIDLASTADFEADRLIKILESNTEQTRAIVVQNITHSMITIEHAWLMKKRPHSHPNSDTSFSYLIHHGFRGNGTGMEEYDAMFRDVKEYIERKIGTGSLNVVMAHHLKRLVTFYNEAHPEDPFEPEWFPVLQEYLKQKQR